MEQESNDTACDLSVWQREAFGDFGIVERSCPLCGDTNLGTPTSRYSLGIWTVKTCRGCRMTYITKAPDYDALQDQLAWDSTSKLEDRWRDTTRGAQQKLSKKTRWRLHLFPRRSMPTLLDRFAAQGNVIDLGCGDGGQMAGLSHGFVPHGIEISGKAAADAHALFSARGGCAVNAPCLEGLRTFPDAHFTGATLRSYLEHELHPAPVLRELSRVMRPDSVAIVKVPNYGSLNRRVAGKRWCGFRHPDHLNYFTPSTLARMARRCGFKPWFGLTWRQPTGDNMWALLKKPFAAAWALVVDELAPLTPYAETALAV